MVLRSIHSQSVMSSGDNNSWRRRRNKSSGDRASPPDALPVAPPSPGNPPVAIPPSTSTTPPKKTWERHYKSFLTRRVLGNSPKSSASDEDASGRSGKFPGSRRLFRSRSTSRNSDVLPPIYKMPDMPILTQSKSNEEAAVRGGNFFQSVFSRNKSDASEDLSGHSAKSVKSSNDGPISPSQRQRVKSLDRIKSVDALDSTLRGGQDKSYHSPKVAKPKKYDDLETPVHGGKPTAAVASRSGGHVPAALSASTQKSREMKKAFTEFHNSATYSLDSSSPYLGDEPSIRPSNYLAMPHRSSAGGTIQCCECTCTLVLYSEPFMLNRFSLVAFQSRVNTIWPNC